MKAGRWLGAVACAFLIMAAVAAKADRPPSWAVGTFRGYNDKYGLDVWLRISRDGRVERAIRKGRGDAEVRVGSWEEGRLIFGRDRFDVERRRSGIVTVKVSDASDVTSFRATGDNDWPVADDGFGGGPPNWAVGSFHGYSDYYDGDMEVKIDSHGRVERTIHLRSSRRGQTGSFRNGRIYIGGGVYQVSRISDGIRLTNVNTPRDSTDLRQGYWESRPPRDPYLRITEPDPDEEIRSVRTGIMGETNVERVRIRIYLDGRLIEDRTVDTRRNAFSSSFDLPVGDYRVEVEALYNRDVVARSQVRFSVRRQR
jgi:hypothetical protein